MALTVYYPEIGGKKPAALIEARLSYYGNYYYLDTTLTLKGRGVIHQGIMKSEELTEAGQRKAGWNRYRVTTAAFDKIQKEHAVSMEMLLS